MVWRKSRRSNGNGGSNCVEVDLDGTPRVRDSKDPGGGVLSFPSGAWVEFLDRVRDGEFDRR